MFEGLLSFQVGGFFGGGIGNLLAYWEQLGIFSHGLPFLLIFALVFGILTRSKIFKENKGLNGVISLVVSLLALQFNFVPLFFSEIFPRLGVGLAVILVALILLGLFLPSQNNNKYVGWFMFIGAFVIFIVVLAQTFSWTAGSWWWNLRFNWYGIVGVAVVLILLAIVWNSVGERPKPELPEFGVPVWRSS